ncbi:MAG TPA: PAS domain S-box protein, partial [Nitrospirota bacterium]
MPSRSAFDHMQSRLILIFLVLAVLIGLAGFLYYDFQKQHIKDNIEDELSAIADLKVNQIAEWRKERLKEATSIARNTIVTLEVRRFLRDAALPGADEAVRHWLNGLAEFADYRSVLLVDTWGNVRLSSSGARNIHAHEALPSIREALRTGKAVLSDFHKVSAVDFLHLDLVAPLFAGHGDRGVPVGAVLILLHPEEFLYPLIQSWPGASKSAETLLIRVEKDEIVYLNELRHQKGTALSLRKPLTKNMMPLLMARQGKPGVFEGVDYREVPVLAAARPVPETPWFLVAKIDREEIYAPLRDQARLVAVVIALLIAAAGLSINLWWRQRNAEYARMQYEAEVKRENLSRQYEHLARYVNDIILLIDPEGRIVEANDRAVAAYGHDREELVRMTVRDIRAPEKRDELSSQLDEVRKQKGLIFETIHIRKDGSRFPVEVSARIIDVGGRGYFQNIVRDISERKQAERALIESEERYKRLVESVTDYIYTVEVAQGRVVRTTHGPGCVTVTGYTPEDYHADPDLWFRMIFEEDRPAVLDHANRILSGGPVVAFEHRIIHKDGSLRWVRNTPVPRFDREGRLTTYDGLITDITRLKLLENQLRQAQKMEAVGQLAGGISHDFNNILTAIIGYANLVMMKLPAGDPARAFVDAILSSAERAAHLTSDLLTFSRKQIINLTPVSVNSIIRRVEKLLVRVIGEDIVFRTRLSAKDYTVLADSIQIEHVLMNLATNARDAMPNGGTLTIGTDIYELGEDFVRANSYGKPGTY